MGILHPVPPAKTLLVAVVATLAAIGASNARAAIVLSNRNSSQEIYFSDTSAFSDAVVDGSTAYSISGNAGDSLSISYTTPHGLSSFGVSTSGGFPVSAPVLKTGTPNDTWSFNLNALNTATGSLNITDQLGVNVAPEGAISTLNTGVVDGFNALLGEYNPNGNLAASGSSFFYTLYIPGNYSATGIGTGEHELLSLNSAWTITRNFTYDGTDTIFQAVDTDYVSSTDRINLQYEILARWHLSPSLSPPPHG